MSAIRLGLVCPTCGTPADKSYAVVRQAAAAALGLSVVVGLLLGLLLCAGIHLLHEWLR